MKAPNRQRSRTAKALEARASAVVSVLGCLAACASTAPEPDTAQRPASSSPPLEERVPSAAPAMTAPPEPPASTAAPLAAGSIGLPGPISLRAVSPTASFAAICQARVDTDGNGNVEVSVREHGDLHGDELQVYLVLNSGAGQLIDDYVSHDPTGRYVAVVREQQLVLLDLAQEREVVLAPGQADVRDDAASFFPHRAVTFSPVSPWLAYLSKTSAGLRVVLRDLNTGEEAHHELGDGRAWRLAFEPEGEFLRLDVVTRDTNGNGRLEWPYPRALNRNRCSGPLPTFSVWDFPGDQPTTKLLRLAEPDWVEPAGFVMTLGDGWITRSKQSELWLWARNAPATRISSESCSGRVLHADARFDQILFGCASAWGQRRQLYYRTSRERRSLGFDVAGYELDGRLQPAQRLVALRSRDATYLLDLALRRTSELKQGSDVLATYESQALVEHDGDLMALDWPDTGSPTWLSLGVARPRLVEVHQREAFVSVGSHLFDLASRKYLGKFERQPLALATDGRGLLATRNATPQHFANGPLIWSRAVPNAVSASASAVPALRVTRAR